MNVRAQYFIQILEKVAEPLMSAVIAVDKDTADNGAQAKTIAELLGKSVQTGISLGDLIDVSAMGEKSDSMRVALAALSASLVADTHKQAGKMLDADGVKNIGESMKAVLTFSENFIPTPAHQKRLEDLTAQAQYVDLPQIQLQYMQAFVPIIDAVRAFAFGHKEAALMSTISSKLIAQAEDLAAALYGTEDSLLHKRIALGILNSLAQLYATCHIQETKRLLALSDDERAALPKESNGGQSLDHLWDDFGRKAAIMETLAQSIVGGDNATAQSGSVAPTTQAIVEAPVEGGVIEKTPSVAAPATVAAPIDPNSVVAPVETPSQNPMAMFAQKPKDEGASPPTTPPESPPAEATPPPPPPAEKTEAPPSSGANPMSFFKTPPRED